MKILLVEDDEGITIPVVEDLEDRNYVVEVAHDGQIASELLDVFEYDIILLDVTMPKMDGITLCRQLRSQGRKIPILMITARDTLTDRVTGLDAGADDYLVKPFELEELSARIRALLRRGESTLPPVLQWGDLCLDPSSCQVSYQNHLISVSPKEYTLLEFFLRNPRRMFTRSQILDRLWPLEQLPEEATIKAHISSLRQKLKKAGLSSDVIETVYGLGYRLRESP
ncbi:response regulator transcription factor [Aphanothece sacrum]|uniref:Two-component sensor histidine kinase n=1 Tax=Aphanothece sacrum FPU1 TaxID=1920663 RepID=A0A401IDY4_APHSA|nr:response regulator transcription factor [Aphanothece sacrum]GBF79429.1 two-component sensor histidine kinase [Aphanothece sacrum FPU1]GBF86644.1 two-component sensor histidine kinase [Aphanothece sacrum FPU3]